MLFSVPIAFPVLSRFLILSNSLSLSLGARLCGNGDAVAGGGNHKITRPERRSVSIVHYGFQTQTLRLCGARARLSKNAALARGKLVRH